MEKIDDEKFTEEEIDQIIEAASDRTFRQLERDYIMSQGIYAPKEDEE